MELTNLPYGKLKTLLSKVRATRYKIHNGKPRYDQTPEQEKKWWSYFRMEQKILEALEFLRGVENERKNQQRFY